MQLEISDEFANVARRKAIESGFDDLEAYLRDLVNRDEIDRGTAKGQSYEQWRAQFHAFISRQVSRNPEFDDSRESIYSES